MKAIFLFSLIFLLSAAQLSAQTKAVQLGIKAGFGAMGFSRPLQPDIILQNPEKLVFGYSAGVFGSIRIDNFSLQPGVFFTAKGAKTTEETNVGDIIYRSYGQWHLYYVQVPVNLVYYIPVTGGSFFVGAGPYLGRALSGKFNAEKLDGNTLSQKQQADFSVKGKFGSANNDSFKSMDYGVNGLAGFQFTNGLLINAGYEMGLSKIQNQNFYYTGTKTRGFTVSIGYMFL